MLPISVLRALLLTPGLCSAERSRKSSRNSKRNLFNLNREKTKGTAGYKKGGTRVIIVWGLMFDSPFKTEKNENKLGSAIGPGKRGRKKNTRKKA